MDAMLKSIILEQKTVSYTDTISKKILQKTTFKLDSFRNNNSIEWIIEYHLDGKLHREDGPAIKEIDYTGRVFSKTYYHNGILNGINKVFDTLDHELSFLGYYSDGKLHRENGPAHIEYGLLGEFEFAMFYIHGQYKGSINKDGKIYGLDISGEKIDLKMYANEIKDNP